jgi:single-strand DNA-binding protein
VQIRNLTADPELRFTEAGVAVANFVIASTPRTFDRDAGQWRDGNPLYLRCTAWRALAESAAESLVKGSRVIAQGRLRQKSFETRDGDKRTSVELEVDELGPSLRFATAKVTKLDRTTTTAAAATGTNDAPPF